MAVLHALLTLAHAGHGHGGYGGIELAAIMIAAMVIPLTILGLVGWAFYRSARREHEGVEGRPRGVSGP